MRKTPWIAALWMVGAVAAAGDQPPCVDEQMVLDRAAAVFPSRYDTLLDLKQRDADRYAQLLHSTSHTMEDADMVAAQERLAHAQDRLARLSADWHKAREADQPAIEAQINEAATAVVDAQIAVRRVRSRELRAQLDVVNAELNAAQQGREASIDDEVSRALR